MKKSIISFSAMSIAVVIAATCMLPAMAGDSRGGAAAISLQTPFSASSLEFVQLREILDDFEARNASVRVTLLPDGPREHDRILRRILANKSADLLEIPLSVLPELAKRSAVTPVNEDLADAVGTLFPSVIAAVQRQGVLYAVPLRADSTQLIYSPAVLAKAGYDPKAPLLDNWNQLLITCAGIRRAMGGSYCPLGIDGAEGDSLGRLAAMFVCQNQGRVIQETQSDDGSGTEWVIPINNDDGIRALDLMAKLSAFAPPEAMGWTHRDLADAFIAGRIAMFYGDARMIGEIRSRAPATRVMAAQAPANKVSAAYVDLYGVVMTAPATGGEYAEQCRKLLAYLCSKESQAVVMTGGRSGLPVMAPVQRGLLDAAWYDEHPEYRVFLEALWQPCAGVPNPGWSEVERQVLLPELRRLMMRQTTPERAAEAIYTRGSQVLATYQGYVGHISETTALGMGVAAVGVFFMVYFAVGYRPRHNAPG